MTTLAVTAELPPTPSGVSVRVEGLTAYIGWAPLNTHQDTIVEVWWSATNDRATASRIAKTVDSYYLDSEYHSFGTYYYWLRAVTTRGVAGAWSTGDMSGHTATLGGLTSASLANSSVSSGSLSVSTSSSLPTITNYNQWYSAGYGEFTAAENSVVSLSAYIITSISSVTVGALQQLEIRVRSRLYDQTTGADVPAGTKEHLIYVHNGIVSYGQTSNITNFNETFVAGFRGILVPGRTYRLYMEAQKKQVSGSPTATLAVNGSGINSSGAASVS